ncbi:MAG: hypothetical protein P8X60_01925 [Robiginitalea sp.]|jgi:hypothetical protein
MNEFDPNINPQDPLKGLFKEKAMEKAPETLIGEVMSAIETDSIRNLASKPLISGRVWFLIALGIILLSALPIFMNDPTPESLSLIRQGTDWIATIRMPGVQWPAIPKNALIAVFALGMFSLLHLIWLKRKVDKHQLI